MENVSDDNLPCKILTRFLKRQPSSYCLGNPWPALWSLMRRCPVCRVRVDSTKWQRGTLGICKDVIHDSVTPSARPQLQLHAFQLIKAHIKKRYVTKALFHSIGKAALMQYAEALLQFSPTIKKKSTLWKVVFFTWLPDLQCMQFPVVWHFQFEDKCDIPSNLWYKTHLNRNKIVDHSDVVGASPVGAAPTTSSFST